ncbi:MAG: HAD family phosphatase [Thermodesulfobacteriota bacterium]
MENPCNAHSVDGNHVLAVMFDFGGVLAEEGFREGLVAIGKSRGLSPEAFFSQSAEIAYRSGYVVGLTDERTFWQMVRDETGISGTDGEFRREILDRFVLRPWMLELASALRTKGVITAILSDQTDWLDELDRAHDFFRHFDRVFNSYHLGKGKRDPSVFLDTTKDLGVPPERTLFIDDNPGNVERAASCGLLTIRYTERRAFFRDLQSVCETAVSPRSECSMAYTR